MSRRTVSEEIRDALLESMASGLLPPGTRLPSERALCEDFGVARTSVREAMRSLLALGRIRKIGNRFHVMETFPEVSVDPRVNQVRELFECRRVMEVAIARLAAVRASYAERAELRRQAESFGGDMAVEDFRRADRHFHLTVARCCGNPMLQELYGKVLDGVLAAEEFDAIFDTGDPPAVREVIEQSCAAHRRIAEAIVAGGAERASRSAEAHLDEVERSMIARMA
ncbi:FCD domain-containing protein [Microtetraspora sp. NBRC 13810]|uniref:FadR/GntR family transcriptional regulator n=1 Tax=Microtetraspora sp. NBRC 13810 TaxID=3030990 RepID=UPI0025534697|nr:FCD domain-containing protein [Microtetraspora sp. NBRC 13810]